MAAFAVAVKRRLVGANPATAIDEGIEHQVEELVGELECRPSARRSRLRRKAGPAQW